MIRSLNENENYNELDAINQSKLKLLLNDPRNFLKTQQSFANYFKMGTLVDLLITAPDSVENKYVISDYIPPDSKISVIHYYLSNSKEDNKYLMLDDNLLEEAINKYNYGSTWVKNTKFKRIRQESLYAQAYLKYSVQGKEIISANMYKKCSLLANKIKSDEFVEPYLNDNSIFKLQYLFNYQNRECKCEIDLITPLEKESDEENSCMYLVDIKTTSLPLDTFYDSIFKYNYPFQLAFYKIALNKMFGNTKVIPVIIAGSFFNNDVRVYRFSDHVMEKAKQSILKAFTELEYYELHGFEYPADYANQGYYLI